MGSLDDAIREHLELKRRHGAAEDELREKEHEAFGRGAPPPSEPQTEEPPPPAESPPPEPTPDLDLGSEDTSGRNGFSAPQDGLDRELPDPDEALPDEVLPEEALEPHPPRVTPAVQPAERDIVLDADPLDEIEVQRAPEPDYAPPAAQPPAPLEAPADDELPPADEPPPADELPPADEPPPADFLEETPDFLEETPEHDRLWFEQREPKDFDFD